MSIAGDRRIGCDGTEVETDNAFPNGLFVIDRSSPSSSALSSMTSPPLPGLPGMKNFPGFVGVGVGASSEK